MTMRRVVDSIIQVNSLGVNVSESYETRNYEQKHQHQLNEAKSLCWEEISQSIIPVNIISGRAHNITLGPLGQVNG